MDGFNFNSSSVPVPRQKHDPRGDALTDLLGTASATAQNSPAFPVSSSVPEKAAEKATAFAENLVMRREAVRKEKEAKKAEAEAKKAEAEARNRPRKLRQKLRKLRQKPENRPRKLKQKPENRPKPQRKPHRKPPRR